MGGWHGVPGSAESGSSLRAIGVQGDFRACGDVRHRVGAVSDRHTQTDSSCEEVPMRVPSNDRGDTNGRDEARLKRLANLRVLGMVCDDGNRTLVLSGDLDLASAWLRDCPL